LPGGFGQEEIKIKEIYSLKWAIAEKEKAFRRGEHHLKKGTGGRVQMLGGKRLHPSEMENRMKRGGGLFFIWEVGRDKRP